MAGALIETLPAYNVNKFRESDQPFHPKEVGQVGYVLTFGGQRIYHTGDSDPTDEMRSLQNIDVMLTPVSGPYRNDRS